MGEGEAHVVSAATRHVMQANKSKNTKPELRVRAALREAGLAGYRLHWKKAPGHPDICYPGRKVAIFVNGCFWHRCPHCGLPSPKSNVEFWEAKFARNRARDRREHDELVAAGWTVLVVWECRLKRARFDLTMRELELAVEHARAAREPGVAAARLADGSCAEQLALTWGRPRVVEIGFMPVWRRAKFARRLRLRHSRR